MDAPAITPGLTEGDGDGFEVGDAVIDVAVAEAVGRDGDEIGDGARVDDGLADLEDVGEGTATGDLRKSWSSCSV
jgi:hypothetical protein